jgi:hypothetical protein
MKQRPRRYFTEADKAVMWDRWQAGDSLHAIARLFDRGHSSVQEVLARTGGIRPAPPVNKKGGTPVCAVEYRKDSRPFSRNRASNVLIRTHVIFFDVFGSLFW